MDSQRGFKRKEIKYILSADQKQKIREAMKLHMVPDSFGKSTVRNIYYDTENYRIIRRSIEKPVYKEKIRMQVFSNRR